jgi:hypothetical protein
MPSLTADKTPSLSQALECLSHLHEPGERFEVRCLNRDRRTPSESFISSDLDALAGYATSMSDRGWNVYHTVNPIQAEARLKFATDDSIARLRWLLYDVDPERRDSAGNKVKDAASTAAEAAAALEVAERICAFYRTTHDIEATLLFHGNGYAVYVPANLETSDSLLTEALLKAHAKQFSTLAAHVDLSVFNPSRIMRVTGTVNRKGEDTEARPHRLAQIVRKGNRDSELTADDIKAMLPPAPEISGLAKPLLVVRKRDVDVQWLQDFLTHSGIAHYKPSQYRGSRRIVLDTDLTDYCPNQAEHSSENMRSTQAVFVGPDGLGFECRHGHCTEIHWKEFADFHEDRNEAEGRGRFRSSQTRDDDREEIVISAGNLNENVLKAEAALASNHALNLYQRGSGLVKPVQRNKRQVENLSRADNSVVVQSVSQYTLIRDVNSSLRCVRQYPNAKAPGGFTLSDTSCTAEIAAHLMDRVKMGDGNYRHLYTVTTSPVMLPDTSILDEPGWRDGVLFVGGGPDYPRVPLAATLEDAQAALKKFEAVFSGFPFVSTNGEAWDKTASYAVLLAGILGLVARPALKTCPIIAASATAPGTGKTEMVVAAVLAALGYKPTSVSYHGEDEFSKALVPIMLEADRAVNIDNVSIPLTGDMLCSLVTSEEHRARILGQSEQVKLTNKAVFFATGNNLAIQGDLTRRAFRVTLDANCERPELRKFDFKPAERAEKLHPELCIAALTALRAYVVAGKPWSLSRGLVGSFEDWDSLVCGCLTWCGYADPTTTAESVIESDPEREANLELLETWWETYRQPVNVSSVLRDNNALTAVLAPEPEDRNLRAIGRRLGRIRGRVIGGYKLQKAKDKARCMHVTREGRFNTEAPYPLRPTLGAREAAELADPGF